METQNLTYILMLLTGFQSIVFYFTLHKKQPNYDTLTNYFRVASVLFLIGLLSF